MAGISVFTGAGGVVTVSGFSFAPGIVDDPGAVGEMPLDCDQ